MPPLAFNATATTILGEGALQWQPTVKNPTALDPAELSGQQVATYVQGNSGSAVFTPQFAGAYQRMAEAYRRQAVAKELTTTYMVPVEIDVPERLQQLGATASELPHYVAGLRTLEHVAWLMHRVWQAQIGYDPATASKDCTAEDRDLTQRYGHPWGLADQGPFCVADPGFPPKGNGVVDAGLATFDFGDDLGKDLTGLGNPFTVIAVGSAGQPELVPYAVRFREWLEPAAAQLRTAADHLAQIPREAAAAAYLRALAEDFGKTDLFPYQTSDAAWRAHGTSASLLFLRFGPDETYDDGVGDSREVKALFHARIGLRSRAASVLAEKYMPVLQEWEHTCTALIGDSAHYVAQTIDLHTPEMVEVIFETGDDIGGPQGTGIGQTLPNWGGADGTGNTERRGLLYVNKSALAYKEDLMRQYVLPLFDESHHDEFRGNGIVLDSTVRHEAVHNIGPKEGLRKPGTGSNYKGLLGEWGQMFEELKAQTGSLFFALHEFSKARSAWRRGELDGAAFREVESWYRASILSDLVWAIRQVQRGTRKGCYDEESTTYPKLAGIQLGFLTRYGGLHYDETTRRWRIDYDRMETALTYFQRTILRLYARSDVNAVAAFVNDYLHGDGFALLHVDRIQEALGRMPSALFRYRWTGMA